MSSLKDVPSFQPIWEVVLQRIRTAILGGELSAGTKLVEADLAEMFGVSRGPVREALRELANEGLVADIPRRGTVVCTITLADLMEVYTVREALEVQAIRERLPDATAAEVERVTSAYHAMEEAWQFSSWNEAINADKDFHLAVVGLAGNSRLTSIYEQMAHQTILLLVSAIENDATLREGPLHQIHKSVSDAVSSRNSDLAIEAIRRHFDYTRKRLFDEVEGERPVSPPVAR
jgi:GntR family transcriptional regulator, gluconate operon transcriptional repressor